MIVAMHITKVIRFPPCELSWGERCLNESMCTHSHETKQNILACTYHLNIWSGYVLYPNPVQAPIAIICVISIHFYRCPSVQKFVNSPLAPSHHP